MPEDKAKIVVDNIHINTPGGHIVLNFMEIPDEMLSLPPLKTDLGVTIKFDKSKGKSEMEIEVDRKIWGARALRLKNLDERIRKLEDHHLFE